jgi:hypothetical protein
MSSYSKQMMAAAREWLAQNPTPGDGVLRIPISTRASAARETHAAWWATHAEWLSRVRRMAEERPDIAVLIDRIEQIGAEREAAFEELHRATSELEQAISRGLPFAHYKHVVGSSLNVQLGHWHLAWARHGYNILDLSADFTSAMLLTDPSELDISSVRMPFAGILLYLPDGFAVGAEGGSYTKIHVVEVSAACRTLETETEIEAEVEADTALQIYATDGVRALDTIIARRGLTWGALDELPDEATEDADRQARQTICRVVLGALAYCSAVSGTLERREGTRRKSPRRESPESPTTWEVGRTIKLDPNLVRSARAGAREVALRLRYRHIVRGHYRDQAHGPGRVERKRIWIAPFWKGPEDGAALVHTYRADRTGGSSG